MRSSSKFILTLCIFTVVYHAKINPSDDTCYTCDTIAFELTTEIARLRKKITQLKKEMRELTTKKTTQANIIDSLQINITRKDTIIVEQNSTIAELTIENTKLMSRPYRSARYQ